MDTRIYICTHKAFTPPEGDLFHILHVGSALHEDLGYERDDTGDNISEKNNSFCELTGVYWVWKNISCDIVGICHYRRYFVEDEDFLSNDRIEELLSEGYDVILPPSNFAPEGSIRKQYSKNHFDKDLDILRDIISELSPKSVPAYDLFFHCNLMSAWNMLITRKEIYDDYCNWLFPILFEAEKRIDISSYDQKQSRLFGYLSERLLNVYFLTHSFKIYEAEVRLMNAEDAYNQQKKMDYIDRLLRLKIRDLLIIYASGNHVNLVETVPKPLDTHGKLPVWVCWWQGFENAPELVKTCRESWYKFLPSDQMEIREITMENYTDYISFPQWILERHRQGEITLTMLSDMLRMELLYRYGGLWMDATYFLCAPLPKEITELSFFTLRAEEAHWKTDITEGLWSGNFLKIEAGALLPQFVMNAFYYYFIENPSPADYYMIDHFIRIAYDDLSEVRSMIDACPCSQPEVMALQPLLGEPFVETDFKKLRETTSIFKLNYRIPLSEETMFGLKTFWSHIRSLV